MLQACKSLCYSADRMKADALWYDDKLFVADKKSPFALLLHLKVLFESAPLQSALVMASPQVLCPQPPLVPIPMPLVCFLPPLPLPVPSYQLQQFAAMVLVIQHRNCSRFCNSSVVTVALWQ